jgi:antiviral helicase SLH1
VSVNVYTSPLKTTRLKPQPRNVIVMTPPCLLFWLDEGIDRSYLESLDTVMCENLELLDATYELAVSLLLHATQMLPVRFIGLTVSVNDPTDLAQWLHVSHENLYHFRPSDRDQVLTNQSHSFTIPHSPALLKAMVKPAHRVLSASLSSPKESTIVFVPSRSQCRKVASDLIMECALEMDSRRFLGGREAGHAISEEEMEMRLKKLHDRSLEDTLMHGIGVLHDGLLHSDRLLTVELFVDGVVRVLVVPRELCWTLPVRAGLVIVMGTQYMQVAPGQERETSRKDGDKDPERQLKNYTIHELVRMQGLAVRSGKSGHFHLLCQAEERDAIMRFLEQGLPLESRLAEPDRLDVLRAWIARRRGSTSGSTSSSIRGKQDAMDVLGFTFLCQRMAHNPVYYDAQLGERDAKLSRLVDDLFSQTEPSPAPPETAGAPSHPIPIAS